MKKILKGAICAGLALTMCAAVGCKKQSLDPETRQLNLSIGVLDGTFNPFTYTSANDGEMVSMTQLPLLTIDSGGNIVYGENQVCAAKDLKITMFDANGVVSQKGDSNGTTEYEITLKKGIMFSDGIHELTIKDVLFNLYVYLDPAYTGSTTIYSTNIKGLAAYRTQNPSAEDGSSSNIDSLFTGEVDGRIEDIVYWSDGEMGETDQIKEDVQLARKLFREEIESDWTSVYSSWEETYKSYNFTEAWEAFLFAEGLVQVQQRKNVVTQATSPIFNDINGNNKIDPDEGETYYTTLDPWQEGAEGAFEQDIADGVKDAQHLINEIEAATSEEEVQKYIENNDGADEAAAILALQRETCIEMVYGNYATDSGMGEIVQYWATATNLYEEILGQLRTKYYQDIKNTTGLLPDHIEGITTSKTSDGYDVLKIVINGVDPKAVFNFAFPVAPLYYYSGTYKGKDYFATADPSKNEFGVEFGDSDFFKEVISGTAKNGVPVGAGPYKATTRHGDDNPTKATFNELTSICYFKRNDYFETVGSGVQNAKIKYVKYTVYSDTKIMEALQSGEIDFGKPNATSGNKNLVTQNRNILESQDYETGGYGYIGVNPKSVPEYKVRQAIMKAMNTGLVIDYYSSDLAKVITRPMSTTSWAYPDPAPAAYEGVAYTSDDNKIRELMEEAGYVYSNGLYRKTTQMDGMANAKLGSTVKLTFTIAGDSTDHPAYQIFTRAAERLNGLGFQITVTNSTTALKSLISGDLDVWAAAWTSATDPDMYQVYHKESTATSVNNWNYKNILKGSDSSILGTWEYESGIIEELSDKIDEGRSYLDRSDRIPVYAECLDLIMKLAVELPTYQRNDLCVYNKTVIDAKSLVVKPNYNIGLFDKLWEITYV